MAATRKRQAVQPGDTGVHENDRDIFRPEGTDIRTDVYVFLFHS